MENISTSEILEKVDELVEIIKNDSNYVKYQELKKCLANNDEITILIDKVKSLQKQLVKSEYRKEDIKDIGIELDELLNKLNTYPLYVEFINTQEEVNEMFQQVKFIIEEVINKKIK